jgi:RNA polymerase primary sigma factor
MENCAAIGRDQTAYRSELGRPVSGHDDVSGLYGITPVPTDDRTFFFFHCRISWEHQTMSGNVLQNYDLASAALLNRPDVQVLSADQERALVLELDACKTRLLELGQLLGCDISVDSPDNEKIQVVVRQLLDRPTAETEMAHELTPLAERYNEVRTKLAMANLRLVAHVARKYRNRGITNSDLLQEGFCGLLKAIDRFQPGKETRLASYAVWWIRQALQRAVAAGAYPVRLNPRHLQQLALSNGELGLSRKPGRKARPAGSSGTIRQIQSATRPTISLNANFRVDEGLSLLDALTYPAQEEAPTGELDEYLVALLEQLKPREQVVIQLRFGLAGKECHSLSQVSEVLDVSKERVRQIQEGALQKLRSLARGKVYCEAAV